jgi:PRC-barrel domain
MNRAIKLPAAVLGLAFVLAFGRPALASTFANRIVLAQAMVPPTGMTDAQHPMPMNKRYLMRFPQPVRVGDLIGLPVLDLHGSTLGHVRQVVRTPQGEIELIVSYSQWWGWFGRPVAVPIEMVGIAGRQLVSLDMPPSEYSTAPIWHAANDAILPAKAIIRVALARN